MVTKLASPASFMSVSRWFLFQIHADGLCSSETHAFSPPFHRCQPFARSILSPALFMTGSSSFQQQLKSHLREHFLTTHLKPFPFLLYLISVSFLHGTWTASAVTLFVHDLLGTYVYVECKCRKGRNVTAWLVTAVSSAPSLALAQNLGSVFTEGTDHC